MVASAASAQFGPRCSICNRESRIDRCLSVALCDHDEEGNPYVGGTAHGRSSSGFGSFTWSSSPCRFKSARSSSRGLGRPRRRVVSVSHVNHQTWNSRSISPVDSSARCATERIVRMGLTDQDGATHNPGEVFEFKRVVLQQVRHASARMPRLVHHSDLSTSRPTVLCWQCHRLALSLHPVAPE